MSSKQLQHFFKNVIVCLGYYDWKLNFCRDYYCWINKKRIDININYPGDVRQIILHEIAHIDSARFCNNRHNITFWKRLEYLTQKFLKAGLDHRQQKHKNYSCNLGFYKLCYDNK